MPCHTGETATGTKLVPGLRLLTGTAARADASASRRPNPASKTLMVEVFPQGDVFGEVGVIDGEARTAQAEVDGLMRWPEIPRALFLEAMAGTLALGQAIARLLSRRLRRTFSLFEAATFDNLEVRLAQQML